MPCIYILRSNTKQKFYIGSSKKEDAEFRLKEHNAGRVRSTKFGRPWSVVYQEKYTNYSEARKRELFLKSGQGRKWFLERWLSGWKRRSRKAVSALGGSGVRIPPSPPVGKRSVWLARYAGSPPDFRRKIEFFVFVPRSGTPEAGFSLFHLIKVF